MLSQRTKDGQSGAASKHMPNWTKHIALARCHLWGLAALCNRSSNDGHDFGLIDLSREMKE